MKILSIVALIFVSDLAISQTCGGPALINENFNSGIPGNWIILDLDGNTLSNSSIQKGFTGKWQSFVHDSRKCVANTCYFSGAGSADDYLSTPLINLGTGASCISWKGASQLDFLPDSYDVLISTTTPDATGFQANSPLTTISNESTAWTEHSADLSAYAGQAVYIAFWYHDTNNQNGYEVYLDDIRISKPVSIDAAPVSISVPEIVAPGTQTLTGSIENRGTSAINSLTLNWKVNGGAANSMNLSSLNLSPDSFYNYVHTTLWPASVNGTYTLSLWTSNVNGGTDQYMANDTIHELVFINTFPRRVLMEEFTQASCLPCSNINPYYDSLLTPNLLSGKVNSIKYQVSWPGVDPMNAFNKNDVATRVYYYGLGAVPEAQMDGVQIRDDCNVSQGYPGCLTQGEIDTAHAFPSIFDIAVTKQLNGSVLTATVIVTAKSNVPLTSLWLRTAVIEDTITYASPPGTNGEQVFYQVLRKLLPDSVGINLPTLSNNQALTYTFSYNINTSVIVPAQLKVISFIQSDSTKRIFQSGTSDPVTGINNYEARQKEIRIFPNPTSGQFFIDASSTEKFTADLFDVNGRHMFSKTANGKTNIDASTLNEGVYNLIIKNNFGITNKKLVILK